MQSAQHEQFAQTVFLLLLELGTHLYLSPLLHLKAIPLQCLVLHRNIIEIAAANVFFQDEIDEFMRRFWMRRVSKESPLNQTTPRCLP